MDDLPWPPKRFRLSFLSDRFETRVAAQAEDELRSKMLRKAARAHGLPKAKMLALKLVQQSPGKVPRTMASSRYMRRHRIKIIGGLLPIAQRDRGNFKIFTLINPKWATSLSHLPNVQPRAVMSALRLQLIRLGSERADGWLFAAYHNEFNEAEQLFYGHVHGIAADGMADVIDKLRTRKCYRSARSTGNTSTVVDPVFMTRQPVKGIPYAISYVLKSYWPRHVDGLTGSRKTRLHEPHHSEVLLWMDRHKLRDITLLMKLKVGAHGIKRVKKRTPMKQA